MDTIRRHFRKNNKEASDCTLCLQVVLQPISARLPGQSSCVMGVSLSGLHCSDIMLSQYPSSGLPPPASPSQKKYPPDFFFFETRSLKIELSPNSNIC